MLLIEEDDAIAKRFAVEVEAFAVRVLRVQDFSAAVAACTHHKLDALFVSLTHPDIDAERLIAIARASSSNYGVPIVALLPLERLETLQKAAGAGASHFLPKPVVWEQLKHLMLSIHWRMVDERRQYRRADVNFPVLGAVASQHFVARCRNLSASGMRLADVPALQIGAELTVAFPYSQLSAAPFMMQARVIRPKGASSTMGLEFINAPVGHIERLRMWVDMFLFFSTGQGESGLWLAGDGHA